MFSLQPPRHISTLPKADLLSVAQQLRQLSVAGHATITKISRPDGRCCLPAHDLAREPAIAIICWVQQITHGGAKTTPPTISKS